MGRVLKEVDDVLKNDASVLQYNLVKIVFKFLLRGIDREITIEIHENPTANPEQRYDYRSTSAIKTPLQATPYGSRSSHGYDTIETAASRAVSGFTDHYVAATSAGHRPQNDWIVPSR